MTAFLLKSIFTTFFALAPVSLFDSTKSTFGLKIALVVFSIVGSWCGLLTHSLWF